MAEKPHTIDGKPYKLKPGEFWDQDSDPMATQKDADEFSEILNREVARELRKKKKGQ
jgi:hypothetical protein